MEKMNIVDLATRRKFTGMQPERFFDYVKYDEGVLRKFYARIGTEGTDQDFLIQIDPRMQKNLWLIQVVSRGGLPRPITLIDWDELERLSSCVIVQSEDGNWKNQAPLPLIGRQILPKCITQLMSGPLIHVTHFDLPNSLDLNPRMAKLDWLDKIYLWDPTCPALDTLVHIRADSSQEDPNGFVCTIDGQDASHILANTYGSAWGIDRGYHAGIKPQKIFEMAQCHNGLVRLRRGQEFKGAELATLLGRALNHCVPKKTDNIFLYSPYKTSLRPFNRRTNPDDRFTGESGIRIDYWKRLMEEPRLVNPEPDDPGLFTVHLVSVDGYPYMWNAIIRHSKTGFTWHFLPGTCPVHDRIQFRRSEAELNDLLKELDIPVEPHLSMYMSSHKYRDPHYSSGLQIIADVMAFFSCGVFGWGHLPVFKRNGAVMRKELTKCLHSLVGLRDPDSIGMIQRMGHKRGCPDYCPTKHTMKIGGPLGPLDKKTKQLIVHKQGKSGGP